VSSSLRRGALAAAALAFSIASLAACAAGNNAQTLEVKPDNAATAVGDIKIQNAVVITQPELEAKGPAAISATVFNNGDTAQTLDSITVAASGKTAEIKPAKGTGKLTIPAGGYVILGGKDHAAAVLPSGNDAITDGNAQKITFSFSQTGDVSLRAFVLPADSYLAVHLDVRLGLGVAVRLRAGHTDRLGVGERDGLAHGVVRGRPSHPRTKGGTPRGPALRRARAVDVREPTYVRERTDESRHGADVRGRRMGLTYGVAVRGRFTARTCIRGRAPSPGSAAPPGPARSSRAGA
jgi:copper(I)-binding protein